MTDAQFALALDYGFSSWSDLRDTVTWSDPRVTELLNGVYRYRYDLLRISPHLRDQRPFAHSPLTIEQHFRNQYHNEVQSLQTLQGCDYAPTLLDEDPEHLTLTVEDVGDVKSPQDAEESLATSVRRLAELHGIVDGLELSLRPCWHTEVSEAWYFCWPRRKREQLADTDFREVIEQADSLPTLAEGFPQRFGHGEPGGNTAWRGGEARFFGFDNARIRQQMVDVEDLLAVHSGRGERPHFADWIGWWGVYAAHRAGCTDLDFREFLYLSLRRSSRRLAKPGAISSDWRQWQIERAIGCLRELGRLT
ncbi:hypothetical protein ACFL6X_02115 [Candidatus Latescibacterota bacterium]